MASSVPAPLLRAVVQASKNYNVPPDLLLGIWRREAGGAFPNPYGNSAGYGGLFGTRNWNAPTQDQANEAAKVLATGLVKFNGNVAEALSYYNSGKPQGGYTSVPGQTTFGTFKGYGGVPVGQPLAGGTADTSFGAFLKSEASGGAGANFAAGASHIPGVTQAEAVASFLGKLTDPHYLLRGLQILAGGGLVLVGTVLLVRQVALAQDLPDPLQSLAGRGERRQERVYRSLERQNRADLGTNRARAQAAVARRREAEAERAERRNAPPGDLPAGF